MYRCRRNIASFELLVDDYCTRKLGARNVRERFDERAADLVNPSEHADQCRLAEEIELNRDGVEAGEVSARVNSFEVDVAEICFCHRSRIGRLVAQVQFIF